MKETIILCLIFFHVGLYGQHVEPEVENEFIGSWSLVSITNIYENGSKVEPYGQNPDGLLIFDAEGNYAIQILKKNRPLISSGNKNTSTAVENAAIVKGFNAHYGRYSVDPSTGIIAFNILHASFPNWENKIQKRAFSCLNGVLTYTVTNTTQGGNAVIAEVVWKKRN